MTIKQMTEVCMEKYDHTFSTIAKESDTLVGGYNWGTGSSSRPPRLFWPRRFPMMAASSFSSIFSRNSTYLALFPCRRTLV